MINEIGTTPNQKASQIAEAPLTDEQCVECLAMELLHQSKKFGYWPQPSGWPKEMYPKYLELKEKIRALALEYLVAF